mgnify:CR=1 FL=1
MFYVALFGLFSTKITAIEFELNTGDTGMNLKSLLTNAAIFLFKYEDRKYKLNQL